MLFPPHTPCHNNFVYPSSLDTHKPSFVVRPISGGSAEPFSCNWMEMREEYAALAQRKHTLVSFLRQRTRREEQMERVKQLRGPKRLLDVGHFHSAAAKTLI